MREKAVIPFCIAHVCVGGGACQLDIRPRRGREVTFETIPIFVANP